jgi:hypothetical protein
VYALAIDVSNQDIYRRSKTVWGCIGYDASPALSALEESFQIAAAIICSVVESQAAEIALGRI